MTQKNFHAPLLISRVQKTHHKGEIFVGSGTGIRPHLSHLQTLGFGSGPHGAHCCAHIVPAVLIPRTCLNGMCLSPSANKNAAQCGVFVGSGTGIRTPVTRARTWRPTPRRSPNVGGIVPVSRHCVNAFWYHPPEKNGTAKQTSSFLHDASKSVDNRINHRVAGRFVHRLDAHR